MRTQVCVTVALILLCSTLSAQSTTIFEGPRYEIDAILAVFAEWERARNAGDIEGVVSIYHPDLQIMTRGRALLSGHAGARTFYAENYSPDSDRQLLSALSEVRVFGEAAIVIGRFLALDEIDGIEDPGYFLIVLRKNDQCMWRIYRDIDTPSPDGLLLAQEVTGAER